MKNKLNLKRSTIILISTLVAIPVGLGLGLLVSSVFAGCLVAAIGTAGICAQTINYHLEQNKPLRDEVKRIKLEQKNELPYKTLDEVETNEKTLNKESVESKQNKIENKENSNTLEN